MKREVKVLVASVLALGLVIGFISPVCAYRDWDTTPVEVDGLVLRPLGIGATILGVAAFFATLPFAAITGTVESTAEALVVEPYRFTFERPVGYPTMKYEDSGW